MATQRLGRYSILACVVAVLIVAALMALALAVRPLLPPAPRTWAAADVAAGRTFSDREVLVGVAGSTGCYVTTRASAPAHITAKTYGGEGWAHSIAVPAGVWIGEVVPDGEVLVLSGDGVQIDAWCRCDSAQPWTGGMRGVVEDWGPLPAAGMTVGWTCRIVAWAQADATLTVGDEEVVVADAAVEIPCAAGSRVVPHGEVWVTMLAADG